MAFSSFNGKYYHLNMTHNQNKRSIQYFLFQSIKVYLLYFWSFCQRLAEFLCSGHFVFVPLLTWLYSLFDQYMMTSSYFNWKICAYNWNTWRKANNQSRRNQRFFSKEPLIALTGTLGTIIGLTVWFSYLGL